MGSLASIHFGYRSEASSAAKHWIISALVRVLNLWTKFRAGGKLTNFLDLILNLHLDWTRK